MGQWFLLVINTNGLSSIAMPIVLSWRTQPPNSTSLCCSSLRSEWRRSPLCSHFTTASSSGGASAANRWASYSTASCYHLQTKRRAAWTIPSYNLFQCIGSQQRRPSPREMRAHVQCACASSRKVRRSASCRSACTCFMFLASICGFTRTPAARSVGRIWRLHRLSGERYHHRTLSS